MFVMRYKNIKILIYIQYLKYFLLFREQMKKVVGFTAPSEFIQTINELAKSHDARLLVDCTRAYYFGARFNVEMEIVLPGDMTVAG